MNILKLKKYIKILPKEPGIYIFKGSKNKTLYIGKASNLKNRVTSYLKTENTRILKMVETSQSLQHKATDSEIEALILESQIIKKYRPPFNIVMRDDKQYFYVSFTTDNFPKIIVTHQPGKNKNYLGPFTDGVALKTTLRYLRKIFPYCTCKQTHHNFCLNYHIEKCPGFCCLKDNSEHSRRTAGKNQQLKAYKKNIKAIKDILSRKKNLLVKRLEKEMRSLGEKHKFEEAIELQNKLGRLKRVFQNAQILNTKYLIRNTETEQMTNNATEQLAKILNINRVLHRIEAYDISNIQGTNATGAMIVFENGKPNKNEYKKFKIMIKNKADDVGMLKEVLKRRFNHVEWPYPDLILVDGGKGQLNAVIAATNPKRQAQGPEFIEGQIQNTKYKIPIIALTKNKKHVGEKIYIAGKKNAAPLSKFPADVKNLILNIDEEAHRFAISYHRKLSRFALRKANRESSIS